MTSTKKYTCIAKANTHGRFIKHRVTNLMKYVQFLDNTFPDWKYFNVYDNDTREQVGSFTKYNRPTYKYI